MTGFAQVKGHISPPSSSGRHTAHSYLGFTISLKSVNHRFLDLHFRLPADTDSLEMKLRRLIKEKLARGHVELTLSLERPESNGLVLNRELVSGYISAFRAAAAEFKLAVEPDLNAVLRMPGALEAGGATADDRLEESVLDRIPGTHVNGLGAPRAPNTSNLRFDGIDSEPLLIALDLRGFAVSSGSACSSGSQEPSHVLQAIGLTKEQARSSLRVSLGRSNDVEQVDALVDAMVECVAHLRRLAPGKPAPAYV